MNAADAEAVAAQRVLAAVDQDARAAALDRLERAYRTLAGGGRLDVATDDLRWTLERLTTVVDQQLATAGVVLGWDVAA